MSFIIVFSIEIAATININVMSTLNKQAAQICCYFKYRV